MTEALEAKVEEARWYLEEEEKKLTMAGKLEAVVMSSADPTDTPVAVIIDPSSLVARYLRLQGMLEVIEYLRNDGYIRDLLRTVREKTKK